MSEFRIEVVRIGEIERLPNSDFLSLTRVHGGYPSIVRTGDLREGDLAVYCPVDSLIPVSHPKFAFLAERQGSRDGKHRVRAARLRGTFSMGLLVQAEPDMREGDDVRERLGIEKYEPPEPMSMGGDNEPNPGFIPNYTDIEGLRRWPEVLAEGEEVLITEKLHGANGRAVWSRDRLWVGSHNAIKKEDPDNMWWKAAAQAGLREKLKGVPDLVLYFEVYGWVQDLRYGAPNSGHVWIACFDAFRVGDGNYAGVDEFLGLVDGLGLPHVPVLHRGPWRKDLAALAEGKTNIGKGDHVREGFVVRPVKERWHDGVGRVILKLHGEGYLLRRNG